MCNVTRTIACLFALLLPNLSLGRLGETEGEIAVRYGTPIATSAEGGFLSKKFAAIGMSVEVIFVGRKSVAESFLKPNGAKFSQNEIEIILAANANGKAWVEMEEVEGSRRWGRRGGDVLATLTPPGNYFSVMTKEHVVRLLNGHRAKEANALKGL